MRSGFWIGFIGIVFKGGVFWVEARLAEDRSLQGATVIFMSENWRHLRAASVNQLRVVVQ